MTKKIYKKEEFNNLDWDYVSDMDKKGCVGVCRGGYGFSDHVWLIYIINNNGGFDGGFDSPINVDICVYELPDVLQNILCLVEDGGKNKIIYKLKNNVREIFKTLQFYNKI